MKLRGEVKKISNGEVAYKVKSDTNNELSELAEDINEMKEFIWEKSISDKFSHPITGLPGLMNLIEKVTDKIDNKTVFSLINISIENFEKYVRQVLKIAGKSEKEINEKAVSYRSLAEHQLMDIQDQAAIAESRLSDIQQPIFLAQAGKDEMIDPNGVFETARKLSRQRVTLQWYPESGHVITVGTARRELEKDVLEFLEKLPWNEE